VDPARAVAGDTVASEPVASDPDPDVDAAAATALGRARAAARAKGLRPGSRAGRSDSRAARVARRALGAGSQPGDSGRDPALLGSQVEALLAERGWHQDVSAGAVMGRWASIVGPGIADHATPASVADGVLTVRAVSSAWATQLTLLRPHLLERIAGEVGPGVVTEIRVVGPGAPSWVRGKFRAKGAGPRDTYG